MTAAEEGTGRPPEKLPADVQQGYNCLKEVQPAEPGGNIVMTPNPYESPRELPVPSEGPPEDRSLEAAIRRRAIRVAVYATLLALVGAVAVVVLGRFP
jgi:hypothetical protein